MNDITELDAWQGNFSDIHKDLYGFRPRWTTDEQWNSIEWLKLQVKELCEELDVVMAREMVQEQESIAVMEATITSIIEAGANDRKTAFRWFING